MNRRELLTTGAAALGVGVVNHLVSRGLSEATALASSPPLGAPSVTVIPVKAGSLAQMITVGSGLAFATNTDRSQVEVFDLVKRKRLTPILVGSLPLGIDATPDGKRLIVCNSGGANVSIVSLTKRKEIKKIFTPSGTSNDTPFSVAVAANGKALLSTTFSGSGFGATMLEIDLETLKVKEREDFGSTTEVTRLRASGDRKRIAVIQGDISSGPVYRYNSAKDKFDREHDTAAFLDYVAIDHRGGHIIAGPGTFVFDAELRQMGTIAGNGYGLAISPGGGTAYRMQQDHIEVLDVARFRVRRRISLPEPPNEGAQLALTPDGGTLLAATESGLTVATVR